ncbi:phage tail protein [Ochrobactrum sp. MYb379]|uniref:phage tail protein n=1 Tax=Ochrobactrum sp. MYb379 TaxID=2745275 RepID=UPI0030A56202
MKILRMAAWVVSLTLCMMLPAFADPVTAAIGAITGLLKAGGIAATLIKLAFGIAFQLGSSLLAKMSAKKQTQPGIVGQVQLGGDKSLSFIVGTYATAGHLEFVNSFGKVDDVENAVLTQVITVSDLPVQSIGNRVFVNGETCNRDPSIVTSSEAAKLGATSYPIAEYKYSRWWFTFLKYYLGDQTTADATLVAKFAGDERPWLGDMIGRGVAYVIATAEFERHLMTAIPAFRFEVQGIKLYDPRKDSTVGGNGPHRWGNEATYEWTDNPIVIAYNILRGIHYEGEFIWGGTVKLWGLPLSGWMAAMNECDILVQIENGQLEKQFRCGYEIRTLDQDPMDVIEELLKSCNGRISESGGIYSVRVGPPGLPVAFLSDGEFVITKEREFDAFPGLENTFNGVTGTWPSPDAAWEMKDAPQRRFPEYEAEDEGRILLADVEFNAVPFANQVQRLMMALAKSNRRFRKHIVTLPPWAAVLDPFDVIALTSQKEGYQNKHFEIMGIDDQPNVTQVASITEVDPSDYDWNANRDTLPWSVGPLTPNWPTAQIMVGWGVQPAELKDTDGISRRPSIEVFFAANMTDVRSVRVKVRLASTLEIVFDGEIPYGDPDYDNPSRSVILNGIFLPDEDYAVQGVYVPYSGRQVIPSAWMPVKTPRNLLIDKDIGEGAITAAKLAAASVEFDKIANEAIRLNHFANSITPIEIGEQLPTQGNFDGRQFYNTADGKMYTWNGTAWTAASFDLADGSVTSQKLADSAVTASKIMNESITAIKLANEAVTSIKIADGAVIAGKLGDAAVTAQKIANEAITLGKFAIGLRPVEVLAALPATGNALGRQVFLTTDSKLYRWNGTVWLASVASTDISGLINDAQLAAINAVKITGQIKGTQITDGAISSPKLLAGAVTAGKLDAGAVQAGNIAAGAVTAGTIAASAVSADNLAGNSVTAGAISAGAVNASAIAAGAVIADKIAAGAISAEKLAVGRAANWFENSDLTAGLTGWAVNGNLVIQPLSIRADGFAPPGGALQVYQTDAASSGRADVFQVTPQGTAKYFDVSEGSKYEFSAYLFSNRCDADLYIQWLNAAGETVSHSGLVVVLRKSGSANFKLSEYQRPALIATAPAGAVKARPFVRKNPTVSGTNSYLWLTRMPFGEAGQNQTEASVWSPSGVTLIDGGNIVTNAITALHLAAGSVTAAAIAANSITAVKIQGGSITGDKIAANTIAGNKMVANSVTARELVLTDYTNLVTNGSFLQDMAGWTEISSNATRIARNINSNTNAIKTMPSAFAVQMVPADTTTTILGFRDIPVRSGERFHVQFDYASGGAVGVGFGVYVQFSDADGNVAGSVQAVPRTTNLYSWQTAVGEIAVPANAVSIRYIYARRQSSLTGGTVYVTNIHVLRKNNAELIVDGAINANHISAGSVTTDKLAANAITAGKVAAGAISATQLAAGAVTADKIASGSIATDKLAVGISRNVLQNSQFTAGLSTWTASGAPTSWAWNFSLVAAGGSWSGPLNPTLRVYQSNAVETGYIDVRQNRPDQTGWKANCYPVNAGDTWEASVYTSAHRCNIQLRIEWRTADGVSSYSSADVNSASSAGSSTNPETWTRLVVRAVAPANAVAAGIHIRKMGTRAGSTDSYMFLYKPFLAEVPPYVSEAAPWSDGGFVLIDGSGIVAGAITADKMNVNNLAALSVNAGDIKAGTLSSPDNKFVINLNEGYWDLFV